MQAFPSTFVTTTFTFENAGTVTGDVFTAEHRPVRRCGGLTGRAEETSGVGRATDTTDDTTTTEKVAKAKKKKKAQAAGE